MKKIVAAWIEQILEFPTKLEYLAYIESLKKGKPQKFKETSFEPPLNFRFYTLSWNI